MKTATEATTATVLETRTLTRVGMLAGVAFMLMYLEFNLPGFPTWLQYDPSEVITLIGGFAMGPVAGALAVVTKSAIFFLSGKDEAGWIGTLAALFTGLSYVVSASLVYRYWRTMLGAIVALAVGIVASAAVMAVANYFFFLPLWGVPTEALLPTVKITTSFNLIKGVVNSLLVFLLYKKVRVILQ